jgi:hypothetical protein
MTRFAFAVLISVLLIGADAQSPAPATAPDFAQYPSHGLFTGKQVPTIFRTPGQRMFRTVIREQAKNRPNFAGHYVIAQWGCGTGCISNAIIDLETGVVYDGPFGNLPKATLYLGPPPDPESTGLFFRANSRLLIARGCPNDGNCGNYFYEWNGAAFKLLLRTPITAANK